MEYETVQFSGVPNYGVRVERPKERPSVAVLNLTDRPKERALPDSSTFGELTAYLCGAGVRGFVYDLRGYEPLDAAERATGIAVTMKRYSVSTRYVGLQMDKVPQEKVGMVESWRNHLTGNTSPSIDAAVSTLLNEQLGPDG